MKVIREKHANKARGFGFVSFMDPMDCAKAIREMQGKYLGTRPMKITRSKWDDLDIKQVLTYIYVYIYVYVYICKFIKKKSCINIEMFMYVYVYY